MALAARGLSVGLVDADVLGFSIPGLLGHRRRHGNAARPTRVDDMILPPGRPRREGHLDRHVRRAGRARRRASSVAVAWRGPLLHRTLQQFLTDVYFGDLDVLLHRPAARHGRRRDLARPAAAQGRGAGRHDPAARRRRRRRAQRAWSPARPASTVIGVVENMAGFAGPDGLVELFGAGGGALVAERLSEGQDSPVPLLASVPLSIALRQGGDTGTPVVLASPDDPAARAIEEVAARLAALPRSLGGRRLDVSVR